MADLLDTSVISQRVKERPDPKVMAWLDRSDPADLFLSAVSFAEIRYGVQETDPGRKRDRLEHWLNVDLRRAFSGRILSVDEVIAEEAGRITSAAKQEGFTPEFADALIAATAKVHDLRVASLNRKHFERFSVTLVEF